MVARSAHPKESLGPGVSLPDLLIPHLMLIYGEAHLRAVRQACAKALQGAPDTPVPKPAPTPRQ